MKSTIAGDGYALELERDIIVIESIYPEPDPDWTFIDEVGHHHDASRATLDWVVTRTYWCEGCEDEHEDGEWRCRQCGEVIHPGTRSPQSRALPGLLKGTLTATWEEHGAELTGTWFLRHNEYDIPGDDDARTAWQQTIRASREPDDLRVVVRSSAG